VEAGFRRWEHVIRTSLRQMGALGRLGPDTDPDHLALATLAALQGGLLLAQIQPDTAPLEAALDAMIQLISTLSGGDTQTAPQTSATNGPDRRRPGAGGWVAGPATQERLRKRSACLPGRSGSGAVVVSCRRP